MTAMTYKGTSERLVSGEPSTGTFEGEKGVNKIEASKPALTMEAIADVKNLKEAFKKVASNKGAAGVDPEFLTRG